MIGKIREVYIEFKPTECWRRLAPEYETWYAWTQADGEWQVMPRGIKTDASYGLKYGSEVHLPWILIGGIDDWLERLFHDSKSMREPTPENRLSFFCDQLLKAGVASEIVEKTFGRLRSKKVADQSFNASSRRRRRFSLTLV